MEYTEHYDNMIERNALCSTAEGNSFRMLHDDFDEDWQEGDEPHGTLTFTDVPAPVEPGPDNDNTPGNVNLKSGIASGAPTYVHQVDFATPFPSMPNVVIAPVNINWGVQVKAVNTNWFKWQSKSYTEDVIIHWIATDKGN